MTKQNFLCTSCRRVLCNDCKSIADEYAELLNLRTQALAVANDAVEKLTAELKITKHQKAEWERMAKLGYADVLIGWIDSQIKQPVAARVPGKDGGA